MHSSILSQSKPFSFIWTHRASHICSHAHNGLETLPDNFSNSICGRTDRVAENNSLNNSGGCAARINAARKRRRPPLSWLEVHAVRLREAFHTAGSNRSRIAMPEVQKRCIPNMLRVSNLKTKRPPPQKEQTFHHNVYVILLRNAVAKHPSILRLNPNRDPAKPCVYVGMTGIPVDHRFENHKNGYKSAWVVRKYGIRLMRELYEHLNPMPFEAAVQMEMELAEDLRAEGYTVTGGK